MNSNREEEKRDIQPSLQIKQCHTAQSKLKSHENNQLLTKSLAPIGCVDLVAVDSCKPNYSHWLATQTVDCFTVDLCVILLSDHNDSFSK